MKFDYWINYIKKNNPEVSFRVMKYFKMLCDYKSVIGAYLGTNDFITNHPIK